MKKLLLLLLAPAGLFAQNAAGQPSCQYNYTYTNRTTEQTDGVTNILISGGTARAPAIDNLTQLCNSWYMSVAVDGLSAISLSLQDSQNSYTNRGGTPAAWNDWEGTVNSGTNPTTLTTSSSLNVTGFYPWMSVYLASSTGTGSVYISLYGWKSPTLLAAGSSSGSPSAGTPFQKGNGSGGFSNTNLVENAGASTETSTFDWILKSVSLGNGSTSAMDCYYGKTAGGTCIVAADSAAATVYGYVLPTTNPSGANQVLGHVGSVTCPTLPTVNGTSPPATCYQLAWSGASSYITANGNTATFTGTSYLPWGSLATRPNECITGQGCGTAGATGVATAPVPAAMTVSKCYLEMAGAESTGALTVKLRKNYTDCGTPGTLTLSVPNASAIGFVASDTTNSCTYAATDHINWTIIQSTGTSGIVSSLSCLVQMQVASVR